MFFCKLAPSSGRIWLHSGSHLSGQEEGALILKLAPSSWGCAGGQIANTTCIGSIDFIEDYQSGTSLCVTDQ